jgi:glycosyltransferase involved in cell wall biosynthesis
VTPTAVLLSYRLGGTDGVSIEAVKWEGALQKLGFATRRVAGEIDDHLRPDDVALVWLGRESDAAPESDELVRALDGADLVVVENVCSLPMNLAASRAAAAVLAGHRGRAVFHHHDLPWQREQFAGVTDLPPDLPGALHVTINDRSRNELAARGIVACTVRNAFDLDAPPGDRDATRVEFGFGSDDLVVLQPTRAIARKDVPAGLRFAHSLQRLMPRCAARFWLTGPAEDGYEPTLERELAAAILPVVVGRAHTAADAYAAADVVVLPSTWEGFGNPVVESIVARRPVAVAHYPVLDELTGLGLELFSIGETEAIAAWLRAPDAAWFDANLAVARRHFSLANLPRRLEAAFASMGWSRW